MAEHNESICRSCFHSYVCEQFNEHRDGDNKKCHFFNDHFVPAADVVEVRHGHWQQNPYCKRIYFCSECGRHIEDGSNNPLEHFPYCHCGAKMDGKGEDNVAD